MKKISILLLSIFIMSFASTQIINYSDNWAENPLFNITVLSDFGVEVIFSTHEIVVEETVIDGIPMKTYGVPGIFLPNDEGAPNLAGTGRYIAIPQGAFAKATIVSARTEIYSNIDVCPAPNIPLDNDDSPLRYVKDMNIYSKNEYYPATPVKLSEPMQIRGIDCVILGVTPFQYNPVAKELIVYKDIRVRIDFEGGNGHFGDDALRNPYWEPMLQGHLLNYSSLPELDYTDYYAKCRTQTKDGRDGVEYIIIVPDDATFIAWGDTIKNWRKLQGISTDVFTLTEIGGSTTTAIENFLNTAYNTWSPRPVAFLILSDYQATGDVYGVTSPIWNSYCVSDNIYADVNGDNLPDMYHARICAQTASQLSIMINKFLSYERNPYTSVDFYNKPITATAWQTERWFQLCGEVIRGFLKDSTHGGLKKNPTRQCNIYSGTPVVGGAWSTAQNTSTVVIYFYNRGWLTSMTNPYDATWWNNGSASQITTAINNGAFLLQHRDHGGETGWGEPAYSNSDINNLTNTQYIFVNSSNCLTGKYNWTSECFTEKFHRVQYGALGLNAASEVSYSFVNDAYVWGMYDCMWQQFMTDYPATDLPGHSVLRPCIAMNYGKYFLQASGWPYNTSDKTVTYHLFHHHGDAFNTLYTEIPLSLTVSHNPTLTAGVTSFTVTANDSSVIALTVNNEIIGVALGTGSPVTITIPSQTPGNTMKVTVTKANYYRYSASVSVIASSTPYIVTGRVILNDSNANGQVNPSELINYGVYAKNSGGVFAQNVHGHLTETDPYITVSVDSSGFGNIPVNDSAISNPYYKFRATNNCPNGHVVNFSLKFDDTNSNTWTSSLSVLVYAPDLTYQSVSVTGGNGNGVLNIGETANLIVTLKNDGGATASSVTTRLQTTSSYITISDSSASFGTILSGNTATNNSDPYTVFASSSTPAGTNAQFSIIVTSGVYIDTLNFNILIEPYLENFDASNGGCSASPSSAAWEWGTPTSGPNGAHSGTKLWATILAGNYTNNADWKLTSREFIASSTNPCLKFWHWYNMEKSSYYPGRAWDGGNVKISTDSGVTFTIIHPVGGYDGVGYTTTYGIANESCYTGADTFWQQAEFTLPISSGQRFFLRWHFGSDNTIVFPGWYVDDISGTGFAVFNGITKDVGVDAIIYPTGTHQQNTQLLPIARIRNFASATQTNFQVICSITGANNAFRYTNTQTITSLSANDTTRVNFAGWTPAIIEGCTVKIRTKLTSDQNTTNDRAVLSFSVGDYIPPAIPIMISPVNGITINNPSPNFIWHSVSDAVLYNIVINSGKSEIINEMLSDTVYTPDDLDDASYSWQIRARDSVGNWSIFSSEWLFTISAAIPGWHPDTFMPASKTVKGGGALVAKGTNLYGFRGNKSNEFYLYNSTNWTVQESMPFGKKPFDLSQFNKKKVGKGSALCYDGAGKIYATKGNSTYEFWVYNIAANTWSAKAFVPSGKGLKGGTSITYKDGKVYLLAGGQKLGEPNFFIYDTTTNLWSPLAMPPSADGKAYKDGSCIVLVYDTIFALKGNGKANYFSAYNISTNTWGSRMFIPLIDARIGRQKKVKDGGAMTTDGSIIFAIKGGGVNEFWTYQPGSNIWSPSDTIPRLLANKKSVPKTGAALAYADGKVYLLKGNNTSEFWQYAPYKEKSKVKIQKSKANTNIQEELVMQQDQKDKSFEITPNPITKNSMIKFSLARLSKVKISLYNSIGELITTLLEGDCGTGPHVLQLSPKGLTMGVYYLRCTVGQDISTIKIIIE